MLWGVGSFGNEWAITFGGIMIRNTNHEKTRMASQGAGSDE